MTRHKDPELGRPWEPLRLFPVVAARGLSSPQIVSIDPEVSFGRPFIAGNGVRRMPARTAQRWRRIMN
jgi:hypothetical protein